MRFYAAIAGDFSYILILHPSNKVLHPFIRACTLLDSANQATSNCIKDGAFIDVGQGDSTVIRTGPHNAIVIDTGNDDGAAARCLSQLKITQIDLLVLSHYHSDHVGGIKSVIAGRQVKAAIGPGGCGGEAAQVYGILAQAGVALAAAKPGTQGVIGNVKWQTLGHSPADAEKHSCPRNNQKTESESELNDLSTVFIAEIGTGFDAITLIALGDLETNGQTELLGDLIRAKATVMRDAAPALWASQLDGLGRGFDIVKVAHHGSAKQSPALARRLQPAAAVFSAGANNTYGHPTQKALELYQTVGATNIRTDQCGTAIFTKQDETLNLTCLRN